MKTKNPTPRKPRVTAKIKNETIVSNGLTEALLGFQPQQFGTQINQVETLFKNNRWYLISNMRQILNELFAEHYLIQNFIKVPVDDAFRGGISIKTKQLSPDQILRVSARMEREDDLGRLATANYWNRLFGGAGLVPFTEYDQERPFSPKEIQNDQPYMLRALDMWELFFAQQNTADYGAAIDAGQTMTDVNMFDYYGYKLNPTRVMLFKGIEPPSFIRPRLRGWGLSVLEPLIDSLNPFLKANNLIFEVLDEFKIDVYKIKNLANTLLIQGGTEKIHSRIQLANLQKNYQNAITMDAEDDYMQKQLSFTGIAETMNGIRIHIASALRFPLSKLFGIGSQGFSSGEDDIENYNSMIESDIRQKSKYHCIRLVELRCQQMFNFVPDDITIEFKPLRILGAEQEENVKTQQFNRVLASVTSGQIDAFEFREAVNEGNLLPIQLDVSKAALVETQGDDTSETDDTGTETGAKSAPKSKLDAPEAKT